MNADFTKNFSELCDDTPEARIRFLESALSCGNLDSVTDVGFCYWYLSDCYAELRDTEKLFRNHIKFAEHVDNALPCYSFWTVSDPNQRFALENGGYSDFWWDLYKNAVEKNADGICLWEEFHAHHAALMVNPFCPTDENNTEFALSAYQDFLRRTSDCEDYEFFSAMYLILSAQIFKGKLPQEFVFYHNFLMNVSDFLHDDDCIYGEWESFTTPFSTQKQSQVMLTSAINALIHNGETDNAQTLYKIAYSFGLPQNDCIEKILEKK